MPPPRSHQLVEGIIEHGTVGRRPEREWLRSISVVDRPEADNWTGPGRGIMRIAAGRAPQRGKSGVGDMAVKLAASSEKLEGGT